MTILAVLSLLLASGAPRYAPLSAQEAQPGTQTFLPFVSGPPGPPEFTIISPGDALSISGTSLFAVQPAAADSITSVAFSAGAAALGVDDTGDDGFQVFLDASQLPAGPLTLSATATGPTGLTTTKSVNVTVVPQPPASAGVGTNGATLATASGNTIIVPPGAVNQTTTVAVTDKTQAQVTADTGIDWDGLGVTFLGAIDVQADGPIDKPLGVSSVGFGNRIQPGQAVVTYRILPDADGDGVGEIVVVNGAQLAPNGTIVSSAVGGIGVSQSSITTPNGAVRTGGADTLQGPPGAMLTLVGNGFNPLSTVGNLAIFQSQVDGTIVSVPGNVEQGVDGQTFQVLLPVLPPGAATLTIKNQSTGATAGPFDVTILAAPDLSQPATTIIDNFFSRSLSILQGQSALTPEQETIRTQLVARLNEMRTQMDLIADDPSTAAQQMVSQFAIMIEGSGVMIELERGEINASALLCLTSHQKNLLNLITALAVISGSAACALALTGAGLVYCGAAYATAGAIDAYLIAEAPECPKDPPPACGPAPAASGPGTTGMGAAPPPGGNGCGNAAGGGDGGAVQSAGVSQLENGRYMVRIFPQSGTGSALTPFTGVTDPGGYFFVPLIPADEPFRAVATDRLTGASVVREGIGPALNQSVYMNFDFSGAQGNLYAIQIGDTITDGVPGPGAGNIETPGGVDIYTFSATGGQQVYIDLLQVDPALAQVTWKLTTPGGATLFNRVLGCCGGTDAGVHTLPESGIYTLRVGESANPGTGGYSFKLWHVPAPQTFPIAVGDTISNGVPGPGAGNIESPGVKDIYTFSAIGGQQVYFDLFDVASTLAVIPWKLIAPDGRVIFDRILNCCGGADAGVHTLAQTGGYTITVGSDNNASTGTYSLKLWNVPAPQIFAIAVGDTISNGVPGAGAGNIESPGVKNIYTFSATGGQQVFFDLIDVAATLAVIPWKLTAPDGTVIFDRILNCCGGADAGVHTLAQTGGYTITVGSDSNGSTGTYGFKLWPVPAPHVFAIAVGDTITNGVPGPGAGNIESPGVKDIYTFSATGGQQVYFDLIDVASALAGIPWKLTAPNGTVIFDRILNCCGGSDAGVHTLAQTGGYTITVGSDSNGATGTYGFKLWHVPAPDQFAIAVGDTISNGVPGPGAGNIESPGVKDIYTFSATGGQQVFFDLLAVPPALASMPWKLTAPDGTVIFDRILNCCGGADPGLQTLTQTGVHTITVGSDSIANVGTYSFELRAP